MGHSRSCAAKIPMCFTWTAFLFLSETWPKHWPVSFIFMPSSYKTCPPYPAGVVYSLLIGPKTIGLTALTLSLAHAPNRETLPLIEKQPLLKEIYKDLPPYVTLRGRSIKDIPVRAKLQKRLKHAPGSRAGLLLLYPI